MKGSPHLHLVALDPPRAFPPRQWRCVNCGAEGLYDELRPGTCPYVPPPCGYCGETPLCAEDCIGIQAAFAMARGSAAES